MTQAVLIAGGKGERLRPVTYEIAKAMIPVHGRTLIDHNIDLFWKYKIYEIWLSLGYRQEDIRAKYDYPFWIDFNDERRIVPLGTGSWANKLAHDNETKKLFSKDFFVCNVDNLFDFNLDAFMKTHKENNFVVTIAATKTKDVREYGSIHCKDDKVLSFEEKKKSRIKKSGWVNSGFYIFSPKVFKYIQELKMDKYKPMSLEKDLFPYLAKKGVLGVYKDENSPWFDTGTFERWEKVIKEWRGISDND